MKIVVTGATGLIGSNLVMTLLENPENYVVAVGLSEKKMKEVFKKFLEHKNFEYVLQDISVPFTFDSIVGKKNQSPVNFFYHAASATSTSTIKEKPLSVISANLDALMIILDGIANQKNNTGISCRLIVFSSASIYGAVSDRDICVTENDTSYTCSIDDPKVAYMESKRMAEVLSQAYRIEYDIDVVAARISYVYGETPYMPDTPLYSFIQSALIGENITLQKTGLGKRDNIYVKDVVSALLHIADKGINGQAYNVSSNGDLDNFLAIDEIAKKIALYSKTQIHVEYLNTPHSDKRNGGVKLSNEKLKQLGWQLSTSFDDGIKNILNYYDEKATCR